GFPADSARRAAAFRSLAELEGQLATIEQTGYVEATPPLAGALQTLRGHVVAIDSLIASGRLDEASDGALSRFDASVADAEERLVELAGGIDARARAEFDRARSIGAA